MVPGRGVSPGGWRGPSEHHEGAVIVLCEAGVGGAAWVAAAGDWCRPVSIAPWWSPPIGSAAASESGEESWRQPLGPKPEPGVTGGAPGCEEHEQRGGGLGLRLGRTGPP
ncbi:hypothetical protein NDU88_009482 [Pleurodeles waltl]|uniref:Uncharacterized protein n=1 Tax=Pleurodeles waltl TaxID=8319 RepID=A0AAV7RXQ1_PLEWA|nr:hypothetical protein NDU88_009482 [Pleurodeles waltl]